MGELLGSKFARRLAASLVAVGVGGALLTASVVNVAFGSRFSSYVHDQQSQRNRVLVRVLATSYERQGGWDPAVLDQSAGAFAMSGSSVVVLDRAGRQVWSLSGSQALARMGMGGEMMGVGTPLGATRRTAIFVSGANVGTALMQLPQGAVPVADQAFRRSMNRLLLGGAALAGLLAAAVGLVLARPTTRRVAVLTRASDRLAAGDRTARVHMHGDDDLSRLAGSFNAMAETVEREDAVRRDFTASVAHELRTPLAIVRGSLEALQDGVLSPSPELVGSLHDETLRLGRLVDDLEALTAADAAAFSLQLGVVDLAGLVRSSVESYAGRLAVAGLTCTVDVVEVRVPGDAVRLRQVVNNLLANTVKYVPAGGLVDVRLRRDGSQALLTVSDTGPGVSLDDAPHLFERFFRGRDVTAAGSGIGLAVVAELVAAHGGTVSVDRSPSGGAVFTVHLPIRTDKHHRSFVGSSQQAGTLSPVTYEQENQR